MGLIVRAWPLLVCMFCPLLAEADTWQLGPEAVLRLARVDAGREVLATRDVYVRNMSPFDRAVRMQSGDMLTEGQFLRHAAAQVLAWTDEETQRIEQVMAKLGPRLAAWELPFPKTTLLIKTTGDEDAGAAYCRQAAVVLPENVLRRPAEQLEKLLAHELFHVLSNQNIEWRRAMYAIVGFKPCNEVELPASLRDRKLTNPDAPTRDYYGTLQIDGKQVHIVPILFASTESYDPVRKGNLFRYLTFRLMAVAEQDGQWQAVLVDGEPVLYDAKDVPSYFDLIGKNTKYIIHPEEVLADNFSLLVHNQRAVPTPRILEEMEAIMK